MDPSVPALRNEKCPAVSLKLPGRTTFGKNLRRLLTARTHTCRRPGRFACPGDQHSTHRTLYRNHGSGEHVRASFPVSSARSPNLGHMLPSITYHVNRFCCTTPVFLPELPGGFPDGETDDMSAAFGAAPQMSYFLSSRSSPSRRRIASPTPSRLDSLARRCS